ncbi:MAG TPA: hypothetical protein VHI95_18060 [Acidimicrobiales bacterium]|nr:hypothetical protein [Acidimicrobiales bacterium]
MTLSERLERAKLERMLAAGLLHGEAALRPEADIDVTDANTDRDSFSSDDLEIEVRATGLHAVSPVGQQTKFADAPVVAGERRADCPTCRRPGNVDMVDLVGNAVHMSCARCGTLWRTPRPGR